MSSSDIRTAEDNFFVSQVISITKEAALKVLQEKLGDRFNNEVSSSDADNIMIAYFAAAAELAQAFGRDQDEFASIAKATFEDINNSNKEVRILN